MYEFISYTDRLELSSDAQFNIISGLVTKTEEYGKVVLTLVPSTEIEFASNDGNIFIYRHPQTNADGVLVCPKCGYHWNVRKNGAPRQCPYCHVTLKKFGDISLKSRLNEKGGQ